MAIVWRGSPNSSVQVVERNRLHGVARRPMGRTSAGVAIACCFLAHLFRSGLANGGSHNPLIDDGASSGPATILLHLSDLHMSTNVDKYWELFGDRQGDLELFARALVPRLRPASVVVTGDVVDGKTGRGRARQHHDEWQAYRSALDALVAAGIPERCILDVRGNHDSFNVPARGGPHDLFAAYAAEGRRSDPAQRVFTHLLPPPGAARAAAAQQCETAADAAGDAAAGGAPAGACPAALLLGIDASPEVGLSSPANFVGSVRSGLLQEVAAAIERELPAGGRRGASGCPRPALLAYLHYPLSVLEYPAEAAGAAGALLHATRGTRSMQGLAALLADANATAVLNGHLHAEFGWRMHEMHATPTGGHMAELETAAWKDDRRFRLLSLDGNALAFEDFYFHTLRSPARRAATRPAAAATQEQGWADAFERRGWGVTCQGPNASVVHHAVLITSPPDARYSPLGSAEQRPQQPEGAVRAAVFALEPAAAEALEVWVAGWLPDGRPAFDQEMRKQAVGQRDAAPGAGAATFSASPLVTIPCAGASGCSVPGAQHAMVQVRVRSAAGNGLWSSSRLQPVRLACASHGHELRCTLGGGGEPMPLGTTRSEWLALHLSWPVVCHRALLAAWAFQFAGMLLLPRALCGTIAPRVLSSQLLAGTPVIGQPVATRAGRALLAALLWPWAALVLLATQTAAWLPLVAYSGYLLLGPWVSARLLVGHPRTLIFQFGALQRLPEGSGGAFGPWRYIPTPDTMFMSMSHMVLCVLPLTLWVACVVGHQLLDGSAGGGSSSAAGARRPFPYSTAQAAALAAITGLHFLGLCLRWWPFLGTSALLLAPGLAWTVPLAVLLTFAWRPRAQGGAHGDKGQ